MSAVSSSRGARKMDLLEKRIPGNPKYKNIKATVDTGASLTKYLDKIEDIKKNYRYKKNEFFKRMKATTFVQLVIQVHRNTAEDIYDEVPPTPASMAETDRSDFAEDDLRYLGHGDGGSPVPSLAVTEGDYGASRASEILTTRSTLLSVAGGIGELDMNAPPPAPKKTYIDETCPYLLLDLRDKDEYEQCHIITATSYPKAMLSRAANYELKEMLAYKNHSGKIILVYDDDERIAHECATTLVERGYDNLFMLSGGLKVALQKVPMGLTTGTPPGHLSEPKPKPTRGNKSTKSAPPMLARQKHFTTEDVDMMEIYLNTALLDNSIGSRLSKSSTTSSRMSKASSRSVTSGMSSTIPDRPAFRPP